MEKYRTIYADIYKLHQKWTPAPMTEDEWRQCSEDFSKCFEAYNNDAFVLSLLNAVMDEINRQYEAAQLMLQKKGA